MHFLYAVRDRVAQDLVGAFTKVVSFRTDAQAVRYFGDSIAMEKSALGAHPNDYELVKLGTLEDDGRISPSATPQILITGSAIVATMTDHKPELVKEA